MPIGKHVDPATKKQVVSAVQSGELTVLQASQQYGPHIKTIYTWLKQEITGETSTNPLRIRQLEKRNEELLKIIGALTVVNEQLKKTGKLLP